MKNDTSRQVDELMEELADGYLEACHREEEQSPKELVFSLIENSRSASRSALMMECLQAWKQSGISKTEFIDQINAYSDYMRCLGLLLKATAIASEQVIPN